jgi:hypothetical protein
MKRVAKTERKHNNGGILSGDQEVRAEKIKVAIRVRP